MIHLIEHTLKDTLGILPFLFLSYLLMEWLEHRAGERTARVLRRSGRVGPLLGGLLGVVPQCGFSASAAGLYAGRVISVGTLLAVFLSTSDEMLPILISHRVSMGTILTILGIKVLIAALAGMLVDLLWHPSNHTAHKHHEHHTDHAHEHGHAHHHHHEHGEGERPQTAIHEMCESEGCHCERGIFLSALIHTLKIFGFILLITFLFTALIETVGEDQLGRLLSSVPVLGQLIAGLIGLIPNCAASVVITKLYLEGLISCGCMMAGLLVGAGIGVMVLFRVNHRHMWDNVRLVGILYAVGVLAGVLIDLIGITF
ncbi:MAG: arsenic efflux protein [Clostridia bacterium]|nr:arsenic efflux protein [Clostridia bacterium]